MNQFIKLFFDECCSRRLARKLVDIYAEDYPGIQTKHLSDFCKCGEPDENWVPLLEKEKDWIVITADRGKDPKKQKLPIICARLGITHISLTPALVREGYKAHKQAILCMWPEILQVPLIPKGTKVSLGYRMFNKGLTKSPWLSIEHSAFAVWCKDNGVVLQTTQNPN